MRAIVIDASNLVHRYYHALKHGGTDVDGQDSGLVTNGCLHSIAKLVKRHNADQVMVAFDTRGSSQWRYDLMPAYKDGRSETPQSIHDNLALFQKVCEAAGFGVLRDPAHEADDLMASAAAAINATGSKAILVSNDKDLFQCAGPLTAVYRMDGDLLLTAGGIEAKYKVTAEQWIEYTALIGEKADNLPGCPGIGKGTAEKILVNYGTVANALAADDLGEKIQKRFVTALRNGVESFETCKKIATLDKEIVVDAGLGNLYGLDGQTVQEVVTNEGFATAGRALAACIDALAK